MGGGEEDGWSAGVDKFWARTRIYCACLWSNGKTNPSPPRPYPDKLKNNGDDDDGEEWRPDVGNNHRRKLIEW